MESLPIAYQPVSDSAEQLQAIYDSVHDAILVMDCELGLLMDVNRRATEMFGYSKSELMGMSLGSLSLGLAPYTQEDALGWIKKAQEGEPFTLDWLARNQSGRLFWVEMNLLKAKLGSAERILITARDISDRKRSESEHSARLKRAESQNAVSLALAGAGPDYEAALDLIVRYLAVQVGDLCVMQLLDEEGRLVTTAISQSYLDGDKCLPGPADLPPRALEDSALSPLKTSREALSIYDLSGVEPLAKVPEAYHSYFRNYQIHSLLAIPMRFQEKLVGIIAMAKGGASRPYSFEDQSMLQSLADRTALTITNGKLYRQNLLQAEELRQINAELEKRVAERTSQLEEANEQLRLMASTDALTGLANRRHFDTVLEAELRRACRTGKEISLLLSDVDFFKRYNDCYGHIAGDICLQTVGQVMRSTFRRASELPARYGGEEFAIILPGVSAELALKAANKLRAAMEAKEIPHERSEASPHVTLSIGIASMVPSPETRSSDLIAMADSALYTSKQTGRNRATTYQDC
ncbi:MAG: diguanylate cyclase [Holophagaceae bacterium]|nr:diguanylate cyclase [Holophagaceae bacterium]